MEDNNNNNMNNNSKYNFIIYKFLAINMLIERVLLLQHIISNLYHQLRNRNLIDPIIPVNDNNGGGNDSSDSDDNNNQHTNHNGNESGPN